MVTGNEITLVTVLPMIMMGIFFISLMAIFVGILIWVYKDAKSRGLNAWLWVLIVALLNTSFIGLILYFLVGRKESKSICTSCGSSITDTSSFCPVCGVKTTIEKKEGKSAKPLVILIIVAVCIFIMAFICMMIAAFTSFEEGKSTGVVDEFTNNYSTGIEEFKTENMNNGGFDFETGAIETNLGDKWNYKASTFDGSKSKYYDIGDEYTLKINASYQGGKFYIMATGMEEPINLVANEEKEMSIDMSEYKGENIELTIFGENASDVKFSANLE